MQTFRISTFNVNGIRAAERKGFSDWLKETGPDIVCLQETKAQPDQIPDNFEALGYHTSWHSAEKKGYSGVGILSRQKPDLIKTDTGVNWIDSEGRVMLHEYPQFRIFSLYLPSGTTGSVRQDLKMEFLDFFTGFTKELLQDSRPLLLCGDFNIAHTEIDIHDPVRNKKNSGFLPEEREWLTKYLELGLHDVFREHHPGEPDLYSWWTYRSAAKSRNKGWRIDYQIANKAMREASKSAEIEREINMSDHVPVTATYAF